MGSHAEPHETRDLLVKLCGMLGSEFDGERAVAALKVSGLLRQAGLRWDDVLTLPETGRPSRARASDSSARERQPGRSAGAPLSDLRADLACCRRHSDWLTGEEADFVEELLCLAERGRVGFRASDRTKLAAIAKRVRRELSVTRHVNCHASV